MLEYICLGAYGIYCCAFCTSVCYWEIKDRRLKRRKLILEYKMVQTRVPPPDIEMLSERKYSRGIKFTKLPTIYEEEEKKVNNIKT